MIENTNPLPPELVEKMKQSLSRTIPYEGAVKNRSEACAQIAVDYANSISLDFQVHNEIEQNLRKQRDELVKAMREFTSAIESEEITIQENFDNDGWESCASRLYEKFNKLIKKHEDGKE